MIRRATSALLLLLLASGSAVAADMPAGKAVFDRYCAVCHAAGPGHPGTMRLTQSRGANRAVLERRADLDPDYIRRVVRQGLIEMPAWRATEINDAALEQLVQYLARRR